FNDGKQGQTFEGEYESKDKQDDDQNRLR
ncbi:membrane protein FxsA, partial [Vibrio vulnificus]